MSLLEDDTGGVRGGVGVGEGGGGWLGGGGGGRGRLCSEPNCLDQAGTGAEVEGDTVC